MIHKALDLAFKTKKYDTLETIVTDLDVNSDPALVIKCATYFVNNKQFEKAVGLLAVGKQVCNQKFSALFPLQSQHRTTDKKEHCLAELQIVSDPKYRT